MADYVLNANKRALSTKGALTTLRKQGKVPGVYYIKGSDTIPLEVNETAINAFVFTSETHIIKLKIEGENDADCIVKDVQFDPVTDKVVHFDLQGIKTDELMQVEIPVVIKGSSAGVKAGGKLQSDVHKLEISVLPINIPEHIEIDITNLNIGDAIHVKDLKFEKFKILNRPDLTVAAVVAPRAEVEASEEAASAEPEVIKKGKKEE